MRVVDAAELLARYRLLVYGAALSAVLGVRTVADPSSWRDALIAIGVLVMVVTFAGHRYADATDPAPSGAVLVVAGLGVVGGLTFVFTGTRAGLLFVAGGLLLINRGVNGGFRP